MNRNSIICLFAIVASAVVAGACLLDGNPMNLPPGGGGGPFIMMTYNTGENTANINSGLSPTYFSNSALSFPLTDSLDTANFAVTLQGPTLRKDVGVTLNIDNTRLTDNYANDSLIYLPLPDSTYSFESNSGVISAGETFAPFRLFVFPNKIDGSKNYMLPISATNDASLPMASNFATIYIHTIGNPLAGAYTWDFRRHACQDTTTCGLSASFTGETAIFAPVNGTTFLVPTGYYVQPNYTVTFINTNGVLSNFKAFFSQDVIDDVFTANGITFTINPSITVNSDYSAFTIHYQVFNGSAYRDCVDRYYKK